MSQFLFVYRNTAQAEQDRMHASPAEMQKVMQNWVAWMKELGEKGVKGKQKSITDGPYAESKDIVGGYTLIEAKDLAQAAELSKGCPIFDAGGMVEVRPIQKMD